MDTTWRRQPPPRATAVLGVAVGERDDLLVTGAGLWGGRPGAWRPLGIPPLRATCVVAAERLILAGAAAGGIARSIDGGATWSPTLLDEIRAPVTCIAVSPRFEQDRVALVGTDGAGVLRSSDGGRRWRLANVGLGDYTVLAVAVTPDWSAREVAFAACADSVYRSPNGGRAWKGAGALPAGAAVSALAVSPRFGEDRAVYVGTVAHGVLRSHDGGASWERLAATAGFETVETLWCGVGAGGTIIVAGTSSGTLVRSEDGGATWQATSTPTPFLCLGGAPERLYGGAYGTLLYSEDAGRTWRADEHLAACDLTRLCIGPDGAVVAYGPTGGAWRQSGEDWEPLVGLDEAGTLYALDYALGAGWLAATDAGLLQADDIHASWRTLLPPGTDTIAVLARGGGVAWCGGVSGRIYRVSGVDLVEYGRVDASDGPVVALDVTDAGVLVARSRPDAGRTTLWSASPDGSWGRIAVLDLPHTPPALLRTGPDQIALAAGTDLWRWDGAQLRADGIDGSPITAVVRLRGDGYAAATAAGVYTSQDLTRWEALPGAPGGVVALAADLTGRLLGLEAGGCLREAPG